MRKPSPPALLATLPKGAFVAVVSSEKFPSSGNHFSGQFLCACERTVRMQRTEHLSMYECLLSTILEN